MYAIVEVGGRQYRVSPGEKFLVEKLAHAAGTAVELPVLLLSDESGVSVGKPYVDGKTWSVKVLGDEKGEKLIAFKYQPKKRYRKKTGHRQTYTILQVTNGVAPVAEAKFPVAETEVPVVDAEAPVAEAEPVVTEPAAEISGAA